MGLLISKSELNLMFQNSSLQILASSLPFTTVVQQDDNHENNIKKSLATSENTRISVREMFVTK